MQVSVADVGEPPSTQLLPPFERSIRDAAADTLGAICSFKPFAQAVLSETERLQSLFQDLLERPLPKSDPVPTLLSKLGYMATREDAKTSGLLSAFKSLAKRVHEEGPPYTKVALSRALLTLPLEDYVVEARPPPLTPPRTPSPPPLATSQFIWDALDRPVITDGSVLQPGPAAAPQ